jgi:hypothetical protein
MIEKNMFLSNVVSGKKNYELRIINKELRIMNYEL